MELAIVIFELLLAIFSGIAELCVRLIRAAARLVGLQLKDRSAIWALGALVGLIVVYLAYGYTSIMRGTASPSMLDSAYPALIFAPAILICALFAICVLNRWFPRSRWDDATVSIAAFVVLCIEIGIVMLTIYCIAGFAVIKSDYKNDLRRAAHKSAKCEQIAEQSAARTASGKLTDKLANAAIEKLNKTRKLDCPE